MVLASMAVLALIVSVAACQGPVAPHVASTETTLTHTQTTGVDDDKFNEAWERLKDVLVATSVAAARSTLAEQLQVLRSALDAIQTAGLNQDEQQLLMHFNDVYWGYEDGVALWGAEQESGVEVEGIPLYRDGQPLLPQADEIVARHRLTPLVSATAPSIEYVPGDTIDELWERAYRQTEKWLLPELG